jgi:hypothetical protein
MHVVLKRSEIGKMNIHQKFPILVIARPSSGPYPSFLPLEAENKNDSNVILHAVLVRKNDHLARGNRFLLNVELQNPNHVTIKC